MNCPGATFKEEVEKAYPALRRAATVLCWDREDVDDAVQETLLKAFQSYSRFRGQSSFFTWAYTILARVIYSINRRRTRELTPENGPPCEEALPSIDAQVMGDETSKQLIDAVRALPQRQREIVTLHYLQDLSYEEISRALEISIGTVKATLFTAKSSLRKTMIQQGIPPGGVYVMS